jgi:DNA-binding transcriptional regulator YiaG
LLLSKFVAFPVWNNASVAERIALSWKGQMTSAMLTISGQEIAAARVLAGLTQSELATIAKVSVAVVALVEKA